MPFIFSICCHGDRKKSMHELVWAACFLWFFFSFLMLNQWFVHFLQLLLLAFSGSILTTSQYISQMPSAHSPFLSLLVPTLDLPNTWGGGQYVANFRNLLFKALVMLFQKGQWSNKTMMPLLNGQWYYKIIQSLYGPELFRKLQVW